MVELGEQAEWSNKCQPSGGFNVSVVRTVFLNGFGDKSQSLERLCVRASWESEVGSSAIGSSGIAIHSEAARSVDPRVQRVDRSSISGRVALRQGLCSSDDYDSATKSTQVRKRVRRLRPARLAWTHDPAR